MEDKKRKIVEEDDRIIIKLEEPIEDLASKETLFELTLRKPKAKDLRRMPTEPTMGDILKLIGRLASLPDSAVDQLCIKDVNNIGDHLGNFM